MNKLGQSDNCSVYIYGTGKIAKLVYEETRDRFNILGFIQSEKTMDDFLELPVVAVEDLCNKSFDKVIMANSHIETYHNLKNLGIENTNIITFKDETLDNFLEKLSKMSEKILRVTLSPVSDVKFTIKHELTTAMHIDDMSNTGVYPLDDYVRYRTLDLLKNVIDEYSVGGV